MPSTSDEAVAFDLWMQTNHPDMVLLPEQVEWIHQSLDASSTLAWDGGRRSGHSLAHQMLKDFLSDR